MKFFCTGGTLRHAITTMEIDYSWKRLSHDKFLDNMGNEVQAIGAFECSNKLRGIQNIRIYWGYMGRMSIEPYDIDVIGVLRQLGRLEFRE